MKNIIKFLIVAFGTVLGTGSNFLIQVFLANKLSVQDFGFFTSLFNIVNLLSPIIAFGITGYLLKCYSEEGVNTKKWFNSIIIFNVISVLVSFVIFNLFFLSEGNKLIILMFFLYMASISLNNFTLLRFQISENFTNYAFWLALPNFSRLVLVTLFIEFLGISVFGVGLLFSIASTCIIFYSFYSIFLLKEAKVFVKNTVNKKIDNDVDLKSLIKYSYPYGLASLFYLIYYQVDIVVLKYYVSYKEIAYYGVSLIFVSAVCLLPTIFYQQVCMPKIHYWAINDKEKLEIFYKKNLIYSLLLGLFFYVIINLIISDLISFVFNDKYIDILSFFYIISIIIPLKFISQSAGAILNINKWIKVKVYIMGGAAFLNLTINLILIKSIGLYGAIYATLVTELFLMICFILYLKFNFRKLYE